MKVLLIGGSSLLGKYLTQSSPKEMEIESTYYLNLIPGLTMFSMDIGNKSQVDYIFSRVKPDIVIHCAAIGSVDFAETKFVEAYSVNVLGTKNIIEACESYNSLLVYISTNAVFRGDDPPYSEKSECHPINRYGSIKKEAEENVMRYSNWIIVRPFLLYGWPYPGGRQNWMTTILKKLDKNEEINLVNDVFWQHTSALDCAIAIWKIIFFDIKNELYHVASNEKMSLYDFGLKVAKVFCRSSDKILPISSDSLVGIAPRPKDTTFNLTKINNLGLTLKNVEEGLEEIKNENKPKFYFEKEL